MVWRQERCRAAEAENLAAYSRVGGLASCYSGLTEASQGLTSLACASQVHPM